MLPFTKTRESIKPRQLPEFLRQMQAVFPNLITKIFTDTVLTDNGLQFTRHKADKQGHIFTQTCKELALAHRTTQPFHPWTNGQVERMNRTIKEATVKKFYYQNHLTLQKHLQVFLDAYNYAQSLQTLKGLTPYEKICLYLQSDEGKSLINPSYKSAKPNIYLSLPDPKKPILICTLQNI